MVVLDFYGVGTQGQPGVYPRQGIVLELYAQVDLKAQVLDDTSALGPNINSYTSSIRYPTQCSFLSRRRPRNAIFATFDMISSNQMKWLATFVASARR